MAEDKKKPTAKVTKRKPASKPKPSSKPAAKPESTLGERLSWSGKQPTMTLGELLERPQAAKLIGQLPADSPLAQRLIQMGENAPLTTAQANKILSDAGRTVSLAEASGRTVAPRPTPTPSATSGAGMVPRTGKPSGTERRPRQPSKISDIGAFEAPETADTTTERAPRTAKVKLGEGPGKDVPITEEMRNNASAQRDRTVARRERVVKARRSAEKAAVAREEGRASTVGLQGDEKVRRAAIEDSKAARTQWRAGLDPNDEWTMEDRQARASARGGAAAAETFDSAAMPRGPQVNTVGMAEIQALPPESQSKIAKAFRKFVMGDDFSVKNLSAAEQRAFDELTVRTLSTSPAGASRFELMAAGNGIGSRAFGPSWQQVVVRPDAPASVLAELHAPTLGGNVNEALKALPEDMIAVDQARSQLLAREAAAAQQMGRPVIETFDDVARIFPNEATAIASTLDDGIIQLAAPRVSSLAALRPAPTPGAAASLPTGQLPLFDAGPAQPVVPEPVPQAKFLPGAATAQAELPFAERLVPMADDAAAMAGRARPMLALPPGPPVMSGLSGAGAMGAGAGAAGAAASAPPVAGGGLAAAMGGGGGGLGGGGFAPGFGSMPPTPPPPSTPIAPAAAAGGGGRAAGVMGRAGGLWAKAKPAIGPAIAGMAVQYGGNALGDKLIQGQMDTAAVDQVDVGQFAKGFGDIAPWAAGAAPLLAGALGSNPIGWGIAGVGALGYGLYNAFSNKETPTDKLERVLDESYGLDDDSRSYLRSVFQQSVTAGMGEDEALAQTTQQASQLAQQMLAQRQAEAEQARYAVSPSQLMTLQTLYMKDMNDLTDQARFASAQYMNEANRFAGLPGTPSGLGALARQNAAMMNNYLAQQQLNYRRNFQMAPLEQMFNSQLDQANTLLKARQAAAADAYGAQSSMPTPSLGDVLQPQGAG